MSERLRLRAEDAADLDVVAAAAQDALARVGDMAFDKKARRFSMLMNRFRWEKGSGLGPYERIQSGISFEGVLDVKSRKLRRDAPDALASLLSITFVPAEEPPGGAIKLIFAGDGEVALSVECLDVLLADIGDPWPTPRRPDHERSVA